MLTNFAFGRHGSFQLRYGWLTKGFLALNNNNNIFNDIDATVKLGVGKNMVASIKYWLQATKIIEEKNKITNFGNQLLSESGFDPYLEDDASLWLIHLKLTQNRELATTLYWLFNHFYKSDFSPDEVYKELLIWISENNIKVSNKTLKMDIQTLLRMYAPHKSGSSQVEDILESPLSLLGLLDYSNGKYYFNYATREDIPTEIIAYTLYEYKAKIISVHDLMHGSDLSLGSQLKLTEDGLVSHLEKAVIKYPHLFSLREDAGIYQLHKKKTLDNEFFLKDYYE